MKYMLIHGCCCCYLLLFLFFAVVVINKFFVGGQIILIKLHYKLSFFLLQNQVDLPLRVFFFCLFYFFIIFVVMAVCMFFSLNVQSSNCYVLLE